MNIITNFIVNKTWSFILCFLVFIALLFNELNFYTSVGVSLTLFSFILYLRNLGDNLPVLELMLFLCGYQWIIASYYAYVNGDPNYPMAVEESEYMSITVLLYLGMLIGVVWKSKPIVLNKKMINLFFESKKNKNLVYIVLVLGFISILIKSHVPYSLRFVNHLLSSLFYVGGLMILYTDVKLKWWIFTFVFGSLLIQVIKSGVFNEFLSWGFFIIMFLANLFRPSKTKILSFLFVAIFFISLLQSVKPYYRSIIWEGYSGNRVTLFLDIFTDALFGQLEEGPEDSELYDGLNSRANQGWVYSKVYSHVPQNVPFAEGETIIDAILDSFLPRFLFPNKAPTFDRDLFIKYTGRELNDTTSMGLGILGEAYANFGKFGSFLFMLIYGIVLGWITKVYQKKSLVLPFLVFLVPIYFEMIIRAISNFSQVINWQVKVTFLFWLLIILYKKYNSDRLVN